MTAKSRANLAATFETGDKPDGDDYADLIDSFLNLTDTSAQTVASHTTFPSLAASVVSATTVNANVQYVRGLATHENPYCEAYADVTAITSVEATAAWTVVCAALTAPNKSAFSVSGREITYMGGVTAKFLVQAQIEARGSANQQLWLGVQKNSSVVSGSIAKGRDAATNVLNRSTLAIVELKGNDVLTLQVQVPDGPMASLDVFGVKYMVTPAFWG